MSEYKGKDPELAYEPADLGVDSEVESRSERSPQEIEREIEQTRSRMSRNIDELGDRLSPSNLKEEAKSAIKDAASGAVSNVGEQARRTGSRLPACRPSRSPSSVRCRCAASRTFVPRSRTSSRSRTAPRKRIRRHRIDSAPAA